MKWPLEVLAYVAATGRDPNDSCGRIEQRAAGDAAQILPYVCDTGVKSILDIGCGLALVDVFLACELVPERVYLLDGVEPGALDRGYKELMRPWHHAAIGASMFRANVDPSVELVTLAPAPFEVDVDLIISTRSWGHRYPVSVYLSSVARSLRPGGVLAVDLRTGRGGADEIQAAGFERVAEIDQGGKCTRVIFRRDGRSL